MQVVTQWVWVKGLRLSIRDGCSGSEAQVRSIRSGMDAVKQCNNINSKQTSSTVIFWLKQLTLWKPQFQMSSLLCVPRHHMYFICNDSHPLSKYKGEANSLENTMRWGVTCTGSTSTSVVIHPHSPCRPQCVTYTPDFTERPSCHAPGNRLRLLVEMYEKWTWGNSVLRPYSNH